MKGIFLKKYLIIYILLVLCISFITTIMLIDASMNSAYACVGVDGEFEENSIEVSLDKQLIELKELQDANHISISEYNFRLGELQRSGIETSYIQTVEQDIGEPRAKDIKVSGSKHERT